MRRSLLAIAILFACQVHANTGWAQTSTVEDIQIAPAGSAAAFYVPATGEVILSVGAGLSAVDVSGSADSVADDFIVENFDGSTPLGAGVLVSPDSISFLTFFGSLPSGVFNIGPILPADPTITDSGSFQDAFGGFLVVAGGSLGQPFEFPFQVIAAPNVVPVLGDFNGDSVVDVSDLDQYIGNLGQPAVGELAQLDLDSDGQITADDHEIHYSQLIETSNGQTGTFAGDANLDGTVSVMGDGMPLVMNLFSETANWATGDNNADGQTDVLNDAFSFVCNLGQSN